MEAAADAATHSGSQDPQDMHEEDGELIEGTWGFDDEPEPEQCRPGNAVPPAAGGADAGEEPSSKKPRLERRRVEVAASLEGIETRLRFFGEVPRFRASQPGLLTHHCTTAEATVSYWPGTLRWSVEGRQSGLIEDLLLQPITQD